MIFFNKPFDRSFIKSKILDTFYKVGFVPFTRKCPTNPKVKHELDVGINRSNEFKKLEVKSLNAEKKWINWVLTMFWMQNYQK